MTLLELALYFMLLSLISVGGMPSVLPELQRYVVDVKGWMTPTDFIQIFAVGQAQGAMSATNPRAILAIVPGVYQWLPKWFDSISAGERQTAAREVAELVGLGLRPL